MADDLKIIFGEKVLRDKTQEVISVNGKTGRLTLDANDVGADPSGSAAAVQSNLDALESKVSTQASASNKLVTVSELGDAISSVEAKQIYRTSSQGSFATKAQLLAATTFYNADGTVATPTKNDVAYVLADETHEGKLSKYTIANDPTSFGNIVWGFVVSISQTEFSQAQLEAISSGITGSKREGYDDHVSDADIHITDDERSYWNNKQDAVTGGYGISIEDETISIDFSSDAETILLEDENGTIETVKVMRWTGGNVDHETFIFVDDQGNEVEKEWVTWQS